MSSSSSPGLGRDAIDLGELEREELGLRRALALGRGERVTFRPGALPAGVGIGDARAIVVRASVGVEDVEVRSRIEQYLVLVLPVQVDERLRQVPERGAGGERAVDERAAAALGGDLPSDEDLAAVRPVEDRLDRGGVLAGSDEVGGSAAADEERDRPDEDRLAGAGLAS